MTRCSVGKCHCPPRASLVSSQGAPQTAASYCPGSRDSSHTESESVIKIVAAILLGLLVAHADAGTLRSSSGKAEFKRMHPCPATGAEAAF